jgi:hypothetical protein
LKAHRFHALTHFVAGGIFEPQVEVVAHYLLLFALVLIVNGRFVEHHCLLPLARAAPEGGHRLVIEGVVCAFLNDAKSTNMLLHFFGIYSFAASARFFY